MIEKSDLDSLSFTRLRHRHPWEILVGKFYKGSVAVLGDAMHVMGPFLGQGGSAVLEDAVVLARNTGQKINNLGQSEGVQPISRHMQIEEAFDQYVRERRKRIVQLSLQTYLIGVIVGSKSSVAKFIAIVILDGGCTMSLVFPIVVAGVIPNCNALHVLPSAHSYSRMTVTRTPELNAPLIITGLEEIDSDIEQKGSPKKHPASSSGGWRSASFILGGGILEKFAYYGVESNLITFLTGPFEESVAAAASQVNTWMGVVSLVPILGALLTDSFVGRYRSIIIFSTLYIMGIGLLTLSATIIRPQTKRRFLFFVSLYLMALAQVYKVCIQAFGADQFDGNHQLPSKSRAKISFFNWWICGTISGAALSHLHYIQDNISWGIGFGIPCFAMIVGLVLFLLGTAMYRFPAARVSDDSHNFGKQLSLSGRRVPENMLTIRFSRLVMSSNNAVSRLYANNNLQREADECGFDGILDALKEFKGGVGLGSDREGPSTYREGRSRGEELQIQAKEQELASVQAKYNELDEKLRAFADLHISREDLHKWCVAFWFRMLSSGGMTAAIEEVNLATTEYGAHRVAVAGLKRLRGQRPIKARWFKQFMKERPKKNMYQALVKVLTKLSSEQLPLWEALCEALIKMGTPKDMAMFPGDPAIILSKGPSDEEPTPEVPDEYIGIELEEEDDEASREDVADTGNSGVQKNVGETSPSHPKDCSAGQDDV
ncbi:OLC1v1015819C1 [Oldenlandia corymbosa var. corymbosa]|uniref:OLC1v1015819C1 n=1 Tax=Oldenlandia corymbosa var. corymbosa TaxID=529605 RepID=A0AAV1E709_OLDCO|nr:OLC1v1015819C1 [Oldenlandia corymbosa var. corymbosa]